MGNTIAIIGAGPTGLAIAYSLKKRGVNFQIFERDSVGYTWKNQYETLHLNSLKDALSLPGMPMPRGYSTFPSAFEFASYLEQYAKALEFPIQKAEVSGINFKNPGFELITNQGTYSYQTVIIATGVWAKPHHPYSNSSPFMGDVLHASAYRTASTFTGKRVLVVGSGTTASDIAVDLTDSALFVGMSIAHGVNIVAPITSKAMFEIFRLIFENDTLFNLFQPLIVKMRKDHSPIGLPTHPLADSKLGYSPILGDKLVEAVKNGSISIFPAFAGFTENGALLADGHKVDVDAIIFATGYRPAIQFAQDHFEIDTDGYPVVNQYQSTKCKNLYLVCPNRDYKQNVAWIPSLKKTVNAAVNFVLGGGASKS